jgi:hypothetical protein
MTHDTARSVSGKDHVGGSGGIAGSEPTMALGRQGRRRGTTMATASRAIALTALTRAYLGGLKVRNFKPKTPHSAPRFSAFSK